MYARGWGCQCAVRDSALRRREYQPYEIAEQQHLPWNDRRVPQHAAEDQPALDQRGGRVGQRLEVDLMARWITLCNEPQTFAEAVAPGQQTIGVELADLVVRTGDTGFLFSRQKATEKLNIVAIVQARLSAASNF